MSKNETDVDQLRPSDEPSAESQPPGSADHQQPDPSAVENPYLRLMAENRLQRPGDDAVSPDLGSGQQVGSSQQAGSVQPAQTFGQPPASMPTPPRMSNPPGPDQPGPMMPVAGSRNRRPVLIIGCAVIALALVATASIVLANRLRSGEQAAGADMSAVVRDYLSAVAAGDADRAIGYLADKPENTSMMTTRVLGASNEMAPITDVSVPDVTDPQVRSVPVSYKLGDTQVKTKINVRTVTDSVLVEGGYSTLDLSSLPTGLPLKLNSAKIDSKTISLFPGSYQLRAAVGGVSLGDGATFAITSASDIPVISARPALTDKGQQGFRTQIAAAITDCLASKQFKAGCGLTVPGKLPGDRTVKQGTVQRELTPEAEASLQDLTGVLDPKKPTLIRPSGLNPAVQTTAMCEVPRKEKPKKTKTEACEITGTGTMLANPVLDLTKNEDPVSWS